MFHRVAGGILYVYDYVNQEEMTMQYDVLIVAAESVLPGKRPGHPAGPGGGVPQPVRPEPDPGPAGRGGDPAAVPGQGAVHDL